MSGKDLKDKYIISNKEIKKLSNNQRMRGRANYESGKDLKDKK